MKTIMTIAEANYRAEIWQDTRFEKAYLVSMNVKLGDGIYKDKHKECESLPEALRALATMIEES